MRPPKTQAYAILRLTLGLDFLLHGLTRISAGVSHFADGVVTQFRTTPLPETLVRAFGVTLPWIELLLGILLILGLRTRAAVVLGSLLMTSLVFGTALRSDWATVGLQLVYSALFYLLLLRVEDNGYALDSLGARPPAGAGRAGG